MAKDLETPALNANQDKRMFTITRDVKVQHPRIQTICPDRTPANLTMLRV